MQESAWAVRDTTRKIMSKIALACAVLVLFPAGPSVAEPVTRPTILSQVTFLYYRDLDEAARFYGQVLGLAKTLDRGWVKVYAVTPTSSVGLVLDGKGFHRAPQGTAAVMISLETDDVAGWRAWLHSKGAPFLVDLDPAPPRSDQTRNLIVADPGGYTVEIFERAQPGR